MWAIRSQGLQVKECFSKASRYLSYPFHNEKKKHDLFSSQTTSREIVTMNINYKFCLCQEENIDQSYYVYWEELGHENSIQNACSSQIKTYSLTFLEQIVLLTLTFLLFSYSVLKNMTFSTEILTWLNSLIVHDSTSHTNGTFKRGLFKRCFLPHLILQRKHKGANEFFHIFINHYPQVKPKGKQKKR